MACYGYRCHRRSVALHLVPALKGFLDRYPDIRVAALLTDHSSVSPSEGADVVFGEGAPGEPRIAVHTLAVPVFRITASPAYIARRGTPRDLADLRAGGLECISSMSAITGKPFPWRFRTADGGSEARKTRDRLAATDTEAALAVAGLGLAQLPGHIAGRALATGDLVEVLPEHRHDGPPISVSCHQDGHSLPKVRAFIDYFVGRFASRTGGAAGASRARWDWQVHRH